MRKYKVMVEVPFIMKGTIYFFDDESGNVFGINAQGLPNTYAVRPAIAQYLWLLKTENSKYLREVKK